MKKTWSIPVKNIWFWILITIVAVLVTGVVALRCWFVSPGIRMFGKDIHVELSRKCYIIDAQSGEVVDETTLTINGSSSSSDVAIFDGELKIMGYQNSATGTVTALKSIEIKDDGIWEITHLENCTHQETVDDVIKDVEHFCDYSYTYYIHPDEPELVVALIESFIKYNPQYAVCADTEEEALARYALFLEK